MITNTKQLSAISTSSSTATNTFETVLNRSKLLAADPTAAKLLNNKESGDSKSKPIKFEDYQEITILPEKLDFSSIKVVAEDTNAGVIYFEHQAQKYKISKQTVGDAPLGQQPFEHLRLGQGISHHEAIGPDHGEQLYNFLHSLAETKGTPAYEIIKDSYSKPGQTLLRQDSAEVKQDNIKSVEKPAEGILKVTLNDGSALIVAKGITPYAYGAFTTGGMTADKLAEGKAQGYEAITALPQDLKFDTLKIVSEDSDAGVILFEHDGHKYMISKSAAADQDKAYEIQGNVPGGDGGSNPSPGPNSGSQLYSFLHAVGSTKGTLAFDYIKNAQALPGQQLLRNDDVSSAKPDFSKVDAPTDEIVVVTQNDGNLLVVSKAITPKAFTYYESKGQTMSGVERAKADGFVKAEPDDYLPSTEDIGYMGGVGEYGPGLIAFTYHKPGGTEQKIIVSAEDNPQMFDQVTSHRTDIAEQTTDVDKLRSDAGLPPRKETSIDDLSTTEKDENGQPLSVKDLAIKTLIDEYRAGIKDGSIDHDDARAKFARALEAKSMAENGMSIIPEHGYDKQGSATDPQNVTSRDVRENIFDTKSIDEQISALLGDESVATDLKNHHAAAVGKVEGGSAKVDETRNKLIESTSSDQFSHYIDTLQANGQSELATKEVQTAYAGLADIDPVKADEFMQKLQIDGYTMELEKLIGDPSKISDDNTALATTDQVKLILQALKAGGDSIPRRSLALYEKLVDQLVNDKGAATDFGKAMVSLGDTWQANGKITLDDINKAVSTELMPHLSAENRGLFTKSLSFLSNTGILGSMGGSISAGRAIYQLVAKGGSLADSARERVGIANDFIGFLSTGSHFATLGVKTYDKIMGTDAYKMMGLNQSLPNMWSKPADAGPDVPRTAQEVQKKYYDIIDEAMANGDDVGKALNGQPFDDDSMKKLHEGIESGIEKRGGISGASTVGRIASSAIKVIGAAADVAGGVISVVTGGLTIRDGVRERDPVKIASGALSVAGGVGGLVGAAGSVASTLGVTGRLIPFLGPAGFLLSGALSFVGAIVGDIQSAKLHKISMQNWDQIKDYKADGLLQANGDEAYVWLQTYLSDWGQRDAPENQSIFDFRKDEWDGRSTVSPKGDNYVKHPDYIGDGANTISDGYKYAIKPSEWTDGDHNITLRTTDGYGDEWHEVDQS